MNTSAIMISVILVAIAIYFVIKPLLQQNTFGLYEEGNQDSLEQEKQSVFTTLAEIELDYQMGKMTEDDYNSLQQKYKKKAVDILQVEEAQAKDGVDQMTEDELQKELEKELEDFRMQLNQAKVKTVRG